MRSNRMSDAAMQESNEQRHSMPICRYNCIGEEELDVVYLNKYQWRAYRNICTLLQQTSNSIIAIDAPSGVGKTFLLCILAVRRPVIYITFRRDQANEISSKNIQTYTFVSFCMHYFDLSYQQASQMFRAHEEDKIKELYKLIVYSQNFVVEDTSVLILDVYTISSPVMLLLVYILSLQHNLHLIFAGDRLQLSSINKSVFHKASNYYIIQILKDFTIKKLNENMRIRDTEFRKKVAKFYKLLRKVQPAGNVPWNYKVRYYLYTLFRPKYFTKERFNTIYIAQTHRNITSHLHRFIDYLRSTKTQYYEAPFRCEPNGIIMINSFSPNHNDKYFRTLLLVEGYNYIYITTEGVHHVVRLLHIIPRENNEVESLKVYFLNGTGRVETIRRVRLSYHQILPDYRTWLYKNGVIYNKNDVWQFPLRPYMLTYHSTLGRTIDEEQVELSAECVYANFLYIGLCSVRHDSNIHKIHDERNLAGYLMTEYMETISLKKDSEKYYYHCQLKEDEINELRRLIYNKKSSEYLDDIEWTTINDIGKFEKKVRNGKNGKKFIRIERSKYENSNERVDTPFMQIFKFVKENPNVILDTIEMASVVNKEDERPYNHLLDRYRQWVDEE